MLAAMLLAAVSCVPLPTCTPALIAAGTPCATPTPTLIWDQVPDADLAGHDLYERDPGGTWNLVATIPCDWTEDDGPGTGTRICRGINIDDAVQRYCSWCAPNTLHEFSVLAYDTAGNRSTSFSNVVSICFSPICSAPGPCN